MPVLGSISGREQHAGEKEEALKDACRSNNHLSHEPLLCPAAAAAAAKLLQLCPTVRPHRRQPTRLPRPWDSPGKNTGVGCHFLLQCMRVNSESEVAQSCPTSRSHGLQPTRLLCPWGFPGKSAGVGCHCLLRSCCLMLLISSLIPL